jgi:hypothetical protein
VTPNELWLVEVAVLASSKEIDSITDAIGRSICGDLNHDGPCNNPWFMIVTNEHSLDDDTVRQWRDLISDGHDHG